MLKLELPFHLAESRQAVFRAPSLTSGSDSKTVEVILDGFSISIETGGRTYHLVSEGPPEADRPDVFNGTLWPYCLLPLSDGISIEQQMMLPAAGDAAAISWRLLDRATAPVRLRASPIFRAGQPFAAAGFEIEPETNGGRLAWRPFHYSAKIIADTNGRCAGVAGSVAAGIIPAAFEFNLGPSPSVLIFCAESRAETEVDPLIGGFLAQLTAERAAALNGYDPRRHLVAA